MEQEDIPWSVCPLTRGMTAAELTALAAHPGWLRREYPKGAQIYAPQRFERNLGILISGRVRVTRGVLPVSQLGPGELFGAAALYNEEPDYVTTLTAQSHCSVLFLPQAGMDELLARFPALARNYIAYLSQRIRFLSGKVEELAGPTAEERILRYVTAHEKDGRCTPDCSWTELAGRLGMSRASLYRGLEALETAGRLRRDGKCVTWIGKDEGYET